MSARHRGKWVIGALSIIFVAVTLGATADGEPAADRLAADKSSLPRELHAVGIYEGNTGTGNERHGGKASVLVNRPGVRVTLLLSSYDSVNWQISTTPDTRLEKVILGGYHRQAAQTLPEDVELVEAFYERSGGGTRRYLYTGHEVGSSRFRGALVEAHRMTGLDPSSFQGVYRADARFVIDRVQDDPRLAADYPPKANSEDLPEVTFRAVHFLHSGRSPFGGAALFGQFTQEGPQLETMRKLPSRIDHVAYDPVGDVYYGLGSHQLHQLDLGQRTSKVIETSFDVPRLSWPFSLTFDSKRRRLLIATLGGDDLFYAYSPADENWSVVAQVHVELSAIAWHAATDTLYGIGQPHGENAMPNLYRFNAHGAVVQTTRLAAPLLPGIVTHAPGGARVQLVSADRHLALLLYPHHHGSESERLGAAKPLMYLIELESGKLQLAWKGEVPRLGQSPFEQAATQSEPVASIAGVKSIVLDPRPFSDIGETLGVQNLSGSYALGRKAHKATLRIDFYQQGKKRDAASAQIGLHNTLQSQAASDGKFSVHLVDLNVVAVKGERRDSYLLRLKLGLGNEVAATTVEIPKSEFDLAGGESFHPFRADPNRANEAPLFALIGSGGAAMRSGQTPEEVVKLNPQADVMISTLEFE